MDRELWPLKTNANGEGEEEEDEEDEDKSSRDKERISPVAYDLLKKQRTLLVSEEVSPRLTQRIAASLLWLEGQSDDPIRVYINTPGGSADDGFAIHDLLRFVSAPVYCISIGLNASAGSLILLAAPRERRIALPNSRFMIHQPSGGGRGTSSDIDITAEEILKLRARANELIAEETGRTVEQVESDTDRDYWMSASEAMEYGLVGRVVSSIRDIQ